MDITYLGHSSFLIKGKKASLVTDPFPNEIGLNFPKVSADIVTISHEHNDHDNVDAVTGDKKVVSGPGEYEIKGISVIGIPTYHDDKKGKERGKNTVYIIEADGVRIVHLGDLGHNLSDSQLESLGDVDVLLIPVGGVYTIDYHLAAELVRNMEPRITIPMHYQTPGLKKETFGKLTGAKEFLTECGLVTEESSKLSLKEGSLGEEQKIVVLQKFK